VSPSWQHSCSSDFKLKVRSFCTAIILSADAGSGFVAPKINNEGIVHPDSKREKKNGRSKVKQQRTVRQNYVFVTASRRGQKYRDYFDPNNAVQLRVMGMEETVVRVDISTAHWSHTHLIHCCWQSSRAGAATSHLRYLLISYTTESRIETYYLRPTRWLAIGRSKQCDYGNRCYVRK
jgi:hypothetical protein